MELRVKTTERSLDHHKMKGEKLKKKKTSWSSEQQQQLCVCFCGVEADCVPVCQCRPQPSLHEVEHLARPCDKIISTAAMSCVSLLEAHWTACKGGQMRKFVRFEAVFNGSLLFACGFARSFEFCFQKQQQR